jgi:hypothetical protein
MQTMTETKYATQTTVEKVWRGKGNLPGFRIAMTDSNGNPVSTVYNVIGGIKARNLALALCRDHRLPWVWASIQTAKVEG